MLSLTKLVAKQNMPFYGIFILGLALFMYVNVNNVANSDGYLYYVTANVYIQQGLKAAVHLFSWPFYAILIGIISKYLYISIDHASLVLTGLLYLFLISSFIDLIKQLGGKKQEQIIGGMLLVTLPLLNEYLEYVIRDHGYVAFLIFGVCQIIKFANNPSLRYSLLWSLSVIIASLFRAEACIVMGLTSLILTALPANNLGQRLAKLIRFNAPLLILSGVVMIGYLTASSFSADTHLNTHLNRFHYLTEWITVLIQQSYELYGEKSQWVASSLSKAMKPERMWMIFVGGFGFFILFKLATGITLLNCIGCYWHSKINKGFLKDKRWWILYWLILTLFVVVIFYVTLHYFLSQRYLLPLIIALLPLATFGLSALFNHIKDNPPSRRMLIILLVASFSYNMLDILLTFGTSKTYIKDAAHWIKKNIDADESTVFTNNIPLAYYSQGLTGKRFVFISSYYVHLPNAEVIYEIGRENYKYAFVHISRKNKELLEMMMKVPTFKILASFVNEKGDSVVIFDTSPEDRK